MATNLQVELSSALQATLGHSGVYAYAVYFDGAGAHWTTLVNDGGVTASTSIAMPSPYISGKVYFIIQSLAPGSPSTLQSEITSEAAVNWTNATTYDFRYDSFELNLSNSPTDQGNLTSVNGFGIPMSVTIGTDTRSYNIGGGTVFNDVKGFSAAGSQNFTYTSGPLSGEQRMVLSPAESVGGSHNAFAASDWSPYVTSLQGAAASNVVISGYFNGAPDAANVWHNAGFYSYQLSWDGANFWLSPTPGSQIKGYIQISPTDLENSIYSTLGTANIYTNKGDATPYLASMNTGANNEWGTVFTQLLTGFTAGYYGGAGNPLNTTASLPKIDLNKTWNWDPTYAFGNNGTASPSVHYDPYAELFFKSTNSYGSGYSDNLMKAYAAGGPLISLWNSTTNSDAATIGIKLFDDSETPTGYVQPVIYNYLPPPAGGYVAPAQFVGDGLNISMSFANAAMVLQADTPITLGFYNGGASGTFKTVSLPVGQSIFQNWNINYDSGSGTYSLSSFGANVTGNILINQVPVAAANETAWYQITVGSGANAKTFNLYATTDPTGHLFLNPSHAGQAGDIQIDGLASITGPNPSSATTNTFSINFFNGLDSSLLTRLTDQSIINNPGNGSFPTPQAPVVGTLSGNVFKQSAAPGANNPTIAAGTLAFGWNGADSTAHNNVSVYTNKIAALDLAHVSLVSNSGSAAPTAVNGTADIDGNWVTTATQFGNGNYTAHMTEYLAGDSQFSTPVAKTSAALTFTVSMSTLALGADPDGNALKLTPGGSGTEGNWVRLETAHSTAHDATLLAYATDADGNLVGRDGEIGAGVTLDEAILGRIGDASSDRGALLFDGGHALYLPVGQEMHFAMLSGDGTIDQSPNVTVSGSGSVTMSASAGPGTIELAATVDNHLTADEALAGSQRLADEAWVYLTQGAALHVETAGSAENVNTAHFVRIDVDAASGAWSVGGVAYGNTDVFRAAVQSNWDQGFAVQNGHGTFHDAQNWLVAGKSGFYAPVLATQNGDIFVIGTANADGREHIRMYGENTFGFEDLRADQHSDFDYNDMIVKLTVA